MKNNVIKNRDELEKRLRELADTEYTGQIAMGAMCYSLVPEEEAEYICPKCGKATAQENFIVWAIEDIREIVEEIKSLGYDACLDEEEFCVFCGNNAKQYTDYELDYKDCESEDWDEKEKRREENRPELIFRIKLGGAAEYHVVKSNISEEYRGALEFLKGQDHYLNYYDMTESIHDNVRIIQKMLGIGLDIPVPPAPKQWWESDDGDDDDDEGEGDEEGYDDDGNGDEE